VPTVIYIATILIYEGLRGTRFRYVAVAMAVFFVFIKDFVWPRT
jgi:hypothetical protein